MSDVKERHGLETRYIMTTRVDRISTLKTLSSEIFIMASSDLSSDYGAVPTLFLVLAICTVSLRTYVRRGVLQTFLVEDWLCMVTLTLFIAQTALLYRFDHLTGLPSSGYNYYETLINVSLDYGHERVGAHTDHDIHRSSLRT